MALTGKACCDVKARSTAQYNVLMSVSLSFRTEESKRDQIDRIAESLDRNRNWVINEAIEKYVEMHRWQLQQIEEGIRDSDAGRTYSTQEVRRHFAKRYADAKVKRAKVSKK